MDNSDPWYSPKDINGFITHQKENGGIDTNAISDGYHTFGELYEHRIALFRALCSYMKGVVDHESYHNGAWKSKLHSDGSSMEGWVIVGLGVLPGEQITYHVPEYMYDDWPADPLTKAPEWDGHTSADVLKRLSEI